MTFNMSGEDTGEAYSLTDSMVPHQGGPPPHSHHREDKAIWVLEGELEVSVGENRFKAGAGSFVHFPKGALHSYQDVGTGPTRFLTSMVRAGLERFFEEVGKLGTDPLVCAAARTASRERTKDLATAGGLQNSSSKPSESYYALTSVVGKRTPISTPT